MTEPTTSRTSRVAAIAVDQAFSSASNGLIIYAVAIVSTPDFFGRVSILLTAMVAVLGCTRGALGTLLLLKANQAVAMVRREARYSLSCAFGLALLVSAAMLFFISQIGITAVVLAATVPFVCAQDVLRHLAISVGRPRSAAVWDGVWCVGTVCILITAWVNPQASATVLLAAWGLCGAVAFLGLAVTFRTTAGVQGFLQWARTDTKNRIRYGIDLGLEPTGLLIVFAVVSVLINTEATGALRGSSALLAPLTVIGATIQMAVISESVRGSTAPTRVWQKLVRTVTPITGITVAAGIVFLLIPVDVGFYLLGESFAPARRVLPATLSEYVAASCLFCLTVFLRTFNRSTAALVLKVSLLTISVVAVTIAALSVGTAFGAAWGLAAANAIVTLAGLAAIRPWRPPLTTAGNLAPQVADD